MTRGARRQRHRRPPEVVGEGMEGLSEFPMRAHGASGWASDGQLVGQTLPVPSKRCQDAFRGRLPVAHNAARELRLSRADVGARGGRARRALRRRRTLPGRRDRSARPDPSRPARSAPPAELASRAGTRRRRDRRDDQARRARHPSTAGADVRVPRRSGGADRGRAGRGRSPDPQRGHGGRQRRQRLAGGGRGAGAAGARCGRHAAEPRRRALAASRRVCLGPRRHGAPTRRAADAARASPGSRRSRPPRSSRPAVGARWRSRSCAWRCG